MIGLLFVALALVYKAGAEEPKKFALLLGGAGEPDGETTLFDDAFKDEAKTLKKAGYQSIVLFNGGHKKLEDTARKYFGDSRLDMRTSLVTQAIRQLTLAIRSGQIKKGDQLLVSHINHGFPRKPGQTTHPIASNDFRTFSLDDLQELREAAEKAGVKLAVIDHSCYSGASLPLGTSKTCVITAATHDMPGRKLDVDAFWDKASPGKDLETIYLNARKNTPSASSPQISTDAGWTANQVLLSTLKRLHNLYGLIDEISGTHFAQTESNAVTCPPEDPFQDIRTQLESIRTALEPSDLSSFDQSIDRLKKRLELYQRGLDKTWKLHREEETLGSKIEFETSNTKWAWSTLADLNIKDAREIYEEWIKTASDPFEKRQYEKFIEELDTVAEKRKALLKKGEFQSFLKLQKQLGETFHETLALAADVGESERELYDLVYRSQKDPAPNPCRDFIL